MLEKKYRFLLSAIGCVAILCIGRIFYLQTINQSFLLDKADRQRARPKTIEAQRGDIKSSDNAILATSVPVYNVYTDTRYIKDVNEAAKIISDFFKIDYNETLKKINSHYYVEVVKGVSKEQIEQFDKVNPRGVSFYQTIDRVYPNNQILGNVLGYIGAEGNGLAGAELTFNKYLRGIDGVNNSERDKNGNTIEFSAKDIVNPINGDDVTLTIDMDIQYQMQKEIQTAVETHKAKKGIAISMNPKTGELLGLAEYPTVDPNNYKDYPQELHKSSALSMTYEPGSTFKPITVAIAGAAGVVDIEKQVFQDGGSYFVGSHKIGNWGKKAFGPQTAREILMNSSNVGTVQIGFKIPPDVYYDYLRKFGFGTKTGVELPGENNSIMFSKEQLQKDINRATSSFGQGISVTPTQLLRAWSIIINGGHNINPHILKNVTTENGDTKYSHGEKVKNLEQIIPSNISKSVTNMLYDVVEKGTGKRARIAGYSVGGKTGTAQIVENGRYLPDKYRVSFVGFAPVENPEVITLVLLDSPEGKASGGGMAAPTVKNILEYSLNHLGISPTFGKDTVSDNKNISGDEYSHGSEKVEDIQGKEITVANYKHKVKGFIQANPPKIPFSFEGEGDIVVDQKYEDVNGVASVVFMMDTIAKDNYIIMPDLIGMSYNEFIGYFGKYKDKVIVNGNRTKPIRVQDVKPGERLDIKNNSVILWSE